MTTHPPALHCLLAAAGLGLAGLVAAPADTTNTLVVRDVTRTFIVHVPPSCTETTPAPVVLMFHGLGSTAAAAASSAYNWQPVADTNGFIVVFPDSLTPPGKNIEVDGFVLYANYDGTGKRWDIAHVFAEDRADSQDLDFVAAILDWLAAHYTIRTTHVFSTGHSYGALFSYYAAACLPDRIRAFAEHSGGLYRYDVPLSTIWWPLPVPATPQLQGMLLHSPDDSVVAYTNSIQLHDQMTAGGHVAELVTLAAGMGHAWDTARNAAQWDFFLCHAPMIDDDQDGMADSWELQYGLNTATNDAADDPDHDGADNREEFVAGTHPGDTNSVLAVGDPEPQADGQWVMAWPSVTSRQYALWYAPGLQQPFTPVMTNIPASPPRNAVTTSWGSARGFFRLSVR